jgi:flagellar basal-body rod protein FlgB
MSYSDSILGLAPQVMTLRARRLEIIANNLANADTPGFKARDIDFASQMRAQLGDDAGSLRRTHARHLDTSGAVDGGEPPLAYRVPGQPSMDGNTVETQREHALFMDNAIRYQASVTLLDGRIKSALRTLRGE